MASTKDPNVDNELKKRKSRVPAAVAKERLVATTISLLRTEPFYEVTTRRITRE
ncbi:MAG: hypothetical protein JHC66_07100, partial [Acidimicrobiia bacterium]|nr:hypothetical protein [Acidimicrobiia bacterium]